MVVEQQLVDYIKKARQAGQTDDQSRTLLYKNGWTEAEVNEAFSALGQPQPQPQAQPKPQQQPQPQSQTQQVQIKSQSQPQPQQKPQPQVQAQQPQAKSQLQPQLQPQVQAQSQTQPKPQPQAQPQPQTQQKPQPQMQSPSMAQQTNMPQMKKRSHALSKLIIILIILIVLGGAGYFIAGQYIKLPWNPFPNFSLSQGRDQIMSWFKNFNFSWGSIGGPKPETVLSNMQANMKNLKSVRTIAQGEVDITDNSTKTPQGRGTFNINSESDISDQNNPKGDGNITFSLVPAGSNSPTVSITVSLATIDGAYYLNIGNVTGLTSYQNIDISSLKGKWLKIDQNSAKAISQLNNSQLTVASGIAQNPQLTKQIQDLVSSENLLSFNKHLSDETVNGQDAYHYLVTVSKDKIKDLLGKIILLQVQQAAQAQQQPVDITNAQTMINSFVEATGDVNIEMWIGKKDSMLYQTKIDQIIDLSKIISFINMQSSF